MFDQAHRLRQLVKNAELLPAEAPREFARNAAAAGAGAKIIVVSAGKAGVGKRTVSANVALALAGLRKRVVVAHVGLRGDVLDSKYSLSGRADASADQCLFESPCGIRVWDTGRSGGVSRENIEAVRKDADFVVLDIPPGSLCGMPDVIRASHELIVIATPEAESVVEAYAQIKGVFSVGGHGNIRLLVNMALNPDDAQAVRNRVSAVCRRFLNFELKGSHFLLFDPLIPKTIQEGGFLVRNHPYCRLAKSLNVLALDLCKRTKRTTGSERLLQDALA
jgi:flagellar biosynthesis protein FlhG